MTKAEGRRFRILVIDDEDVYCKQLAAILGREGYEVRTARAAAEGIALGTRYRPDLLIVDWAFPDGRNGLEVGEALRTVRPGLRVLAITGHSAEDLATVARGSVAEILEKPFGIDDLVAAIDRALASPEA